MTEVILTLPWPPSVNHYKKPGRLTRTSSGKLYQTRVNTSETMGFYYQVYMKCKANMPKEGSPFFQDSTIRVGVTIDLHPPHKKRYDIDNRLKVLFDSLTHAKVWQDDSQVQRLFVQKMSPCKVGEVKMIIYSL